MRDGFGGSDAVAFRGVGNDYRKFVGSGESEKSAEEMILEKGHKGLVGGGIWGVLGVSLLSVPWLWPCKRVSFLICFLQTLF